MKTKKTLTAFSQDFLYKKEAKKILEEFRQNVFFSPIGYVKDDNETVLSLEVNI